MASGKSLELAAIKPPPPDWKCSCGAPWKTHERKDGKGVLKKFQDKAVHHPMGGEGYNRRQRRAMGICGH